MANIKSPIGSKTFTSTPGSASFRTYEVPDESTQYDDLEDHEHENHEHFQARDRFTTNYSAQASEEIDNQFKNQKQPRSSSHTVLTSEAKKRIELLTGLGRGTKEVKVNGVSFSLRTLKSKEMQEILFAAANVPMINSSYEGHKHLLAKAITQIDGVNFGLVIGSDDFKDKLDFIENLEDNVFNFLKEQFDLLAKEASGKFSLKTEEEINKTVDEIKK